MPTRTGTPARLLRQDRRGAGGRGGAGSGGYAFVSRRQLPDSCIPGSSPMRRCPSRGYSVCPVVAGTRTQRRQEMLLEDKNAVVCAKCDQSA